MQMLSMSFVPLHNFENFTEYAYESTIDFSVILRYRNDVQGLAFYVLINMYVHITCKWRRCKKKLYLKLCRSTTKYKEVGYNPKNFTRQRNFPL